MTAPVLAAHAAPVPVEPESTAVTPGEAAPVPVAVESTAVLQVQTAPDSAGVLLVIPESTAVVQKVTVPAAPAKKERRVEPSYRVVLRSLVYPGWGQLYNGKQLKALAVFVSEGAILGMIYTESRAASRAYDKHLAATDDAVAARLYSEYDRHFERQQTYSWWVVGLVLFSLADAYVDANLITFDEEFGDKEEKVGFFFQPDQFSAGGFVCLNYGF